MCLILFAHKAHRDLPLVVAANRDEAYLRPSRAADFWPEAPGVLGGKDLRAGGTWLGFTRQGRWAAVTNFRDGDRPGSTGARSRGELTRAFLLGRQSPWEYAQALLDQGGDYNHFNLLVGDGDQLVYCNNIEPLARELPPGIYGLSNHLLDTDWPKVEKGRRALREMLTAYEAPIPESELRPFSRELLNLLGDDHPAPDDELPDTGVDRDTERLLSPLFIESQHYGTCCSTTLLVHRDKRALFRERSFYRSPPDDNLYELNLD